jgi:hypothetical protein
MRLREILAALYQWMACLFISSLVLAQLFGSVWNTTTTTRHVNYGHAPDLGPFQVVGRTIFRTSTVFSLVYAP